LVELGSRELLEKFHGFLEGEGLSGIYQFAGRHVAFGAV
jgi:hypothetical protein